jgi:hypothetical protein
MLKYPYWGTKTKFIIASFNALTRFLKANIYKPNELISTYGVSSTIRFEAVVLVQSLKCKDCAN